MKNFTIGLNAALVIAVAVLFYLQFSGKKAAVTASPAGATNSSFKIAYFVEDSLQSGFEYYSERVKELAAKQQQIRTQLLAERNAFGEKVREYQAKGQTMTQMEAAKANQDIEQRQKTMQTNEQEKSQTFEEERFKVGQDIRTKIEAFLKDYNKNKTYAFVLSSSSEIIYYKDSTYDITKDLIKGLNEKYPKKK